MKPTRTIPEAEARRYVAEGWWENKTLLEPFDAAVARTPHKTAVVAPGGVRLTYAQLADKVRQVACGLAQAGVGQGDVVSVQLPNCAEALVLHLAITRLGAVTNPLLPTYRAKELRYILGFAHTKVAIIPAEYRKFDFPAMYAELRQDLPDLKGIFVLGDKLAPGMRRFEELYVEGEPPVVQQDPNDVTVLIFTSGTESTPKGVMHSHNTFMHATTNMARVCQVTADDVIWTPSPVGHGTGFGWGIRFVPALGATLVLQDLWDEEEALRLLEQERCTWVLAATPFVVMLLESEALRRRKWDLHLKTFVCAGAPIPRLIGEQAREKLGCTLVGAWGQTEGYMASVPPVTAADEKLWNTDGCAITGGVELAVFDEETRMRMLPPGELGELATRGPNVSLGYFNDPERTAAVFRDDGWLFTNDLATMDEDGFIRIAGRKKDIINRGGLKYSSREIEELLLQHPAVAQVALVSLPDKRVGEKACACIVVRPGTTVTFPEIVDHLSRRELARFKLPEYLALTDAIPMTPSGKVQKFILRDEILKGTRATTPAYERDPQSELQYSPT
jgi:acyl-CoA synthetase (AMP-forming)/AMP-acid ligase II